MKLSPLQLLSYQLQSVSCNARIDFDSNKPTILRTKAFKTESRISAVESKDVDGSTTWKVELTVSQSDDAKANTPYAFEIILTGVFRLTSKIGDVAPAVFVRVNGSSILFGIAREIVRGLTSTGPWGNMLIPTVSFALDSPALTSDVPKKLPARKSRK
jgi:preprotein translocase subunit SecB